MKQFLKDCWEAFKEVQSLRAQAVVKGHHWY